MDSNNKPQKKEPTDPKDQESYWDKVRKPDVLPVWLGSTAAILAGVIGVITLIKISKQTAAAVDAANAAKVSAEIAMSSERAWIVEEIIFPNELPPYRPDFVMIVSLRFKNVGKIPAKITDIFVRFHTFMSADSLADIPDYRKDYVVLELGMNGALVAPNDSIMFARHYEGKLQHLTEDEILHIRLGILRLCCYGEVKYSDGFKEDRVTQFCYVFENKNGVTLLPGGFRKIGPPNYNYIT